MSVAAAAVLKWSPKAHKQLSKCSPAALERRTEIAQKMFNSPPVYNNPYFEADKIRNHITNLQYKFFYDKYRKVFKKSRIIIATHYYNIPRNDLAIKGKMLAQKHKMALTFPKPHVAPEATEGTPAECLASLLRNDFTALFYSRSTKTNRLGSADSFEELRAAVKAVKSFPSVQILCVLVDGQPITPDELKNLLSGDSPVARLGSALYSMPHMQLPKLLSFPNTQLIRALRWYVDEHSPKDETIEN
eukprot:141839_1